MEIKEIRNRNSNEDNYHYENLKIAREFAKGVIKEMASLVKSVVIFGSTSINENIKESDIDVLVILDNISVIVTNELKEAYHLLVESLIDNISEKLHVTSMNLTDFWDLVRKGDPVIINILRTGFPLYDESLFEPVQFLLRIGRIKPTRETVINYKGRAEETLDGIYSYLQKAVIDMYFSVFDLAYACLICEKKMPVTPKDLPDKFEVVFKGTFLYKYGKSLREFYEIYKKVEHENFIIDGKAYDRLLKKALQIRKDFVTYINEKLRSTDIFDL